MQVQQSAQTKDHGAGETAGAEPPASGCGLLCCCQEGLCTRRDDPDPRTNLMCCLPGEAHGTSLSTRFHVYVLCAQALLYVPIAALARAGAFDWLFSVAGCDGDAHCVTNHCLMASGFAVSVWYFYLWTCNVPLQFLCARDVHYRCWTVNLLLLFGMLVGGWCIPVVFYEQVYRQTTAVVVGTLFLPAWILAIINQGMSWYELWLNPPAEACTEGASPHHWRRGLYTLAFALLVLQYLALGWFPVWFGGATRDAPCVWQNVVIGAFALVMLVTLGLCFCERFERASVPAVAVVGFALVSWMFDAFVTHNDEECSMIGFRSSALSRMSLLSLCNYAVQALSAVQVVLGCMAADIQEQPGRADAEAPAVAPAEKGVGCLYACCCLASGYVTMVATAWGVDDPDDESTMLTSVRFSMVALCLALWYWVICVPLMSCCDGDE
jgi:hypothetical protein